MEFDKHLNQRLKLMAADMIESSIQRTFAAFETHLNKGINLPGLDATGYVIPLEVCSMVNVVLDAKNQSLKLCAVDGVDVVIMIEILMNLYNLSHFSAQISHQN